MTQPRDMQAAQSSSRGSGSQGVQILTRREGLQALASAVALNEIGLTSGNAMERGDHVIGQSALKCSSISDVLPVDGNICTVKVCKSNFADKSSRAWVTYSGGSATCLWHGKIMLKDVGEGFSYL